MLASAYTWSRKGRSLRLPSTGAKNEPQNPAGKSLSSRQRCPQGRRMSPVPLLVRASSSHQQCPPKAKKKKPKAPGVKPGAERAGACDCPQLGRRMSPPTAKGARFSCDLGIKGQELANARKNRHGPQHMPKKERAQKSGFSQLFGHASCYAHARSRASAISNSLFFILYFIEDL